jgi:ATP-dependent RNA helicase DHX29
MYAGIIAIDGNRVRFSVEDWKSMLAVKILSTRVRDILSLTLRNPQKLLALSDKQQKWLEIWQQVFTHAYRKKNQGDTKIL